MKWFWTILVLLYALSPYDIVPDFLPGWGWLDDIAGLVLLYAVYFASGRFRSTRFKPAGRQRTAEDRQKAGGAARDPEPEPAAPRTPWDVLGVEPGAAPEEIRRAYRRLAATYHPDKMTHLGEDFRRLAEQRFKEIQEAYQAIKSEDS